MVVIRKVVQARLSVTYLNFITTFVVLYCKNKFSIYLLEIICYSTPSPRFVAVVFFFGSILFDVVVRSSRCWFSTTWGETFICMVGQNICTGMVRNFCTGLGKTFYRVNRNVCREWVEAFVLGVRNIFTESVEAFARLGLKLLLRVRQNICIGWVEAFVLGGLQHLFRMGRNNLYRFGQT